jgi:dimeric dUTPase (all-alpha-NTP-PPase superfamily)
MNKILELIKEHQTAIGQNPPADRMQYIRDLTLATHVELAEFIQELPWKPWKNNKHYDLNAASDELADIFIFTFDLWLALGTSRDLEYTVRNKIAGNMSRLKKKEHIKHK